MRLIDAEWLEKQAVCIYTYGGTRFVSVDTIKKATTIEAEPVKHGRWIKHYVDGTNMNGKPTKILFACNCSQCELDGEYPTNYCPNCGAKMDLEE